MAGMTATLEAPAAILARPSEVLHPVSQLAPEPVAVDTETSGLYVDDGARACAVSVTYRTIDGQLHEWAFPFDQGRHEAKGFGIRRYKNGSIYGLRDYTLAEIEAAAAEGRVLSGHRPLEEQEELLRLWTEDVNLPDSEWRYLLEWLVASGREHGHAYQNAQFDLLIFDAGLRSGAEGAWLEPYVLWDTMLVSKRLWPTESTSLKPTAARLWGEAEVAEAQAVRDALITAKKLFGLTADDGPRYDLLPWRILGPYAGKDTTLTHRLRDMQETMLDDGLADWGKVRIDLDLMRVLTRMSRRGFGPYAVEESHAVADKISARMAELRTVMLPELLGEDGTPNAARATRYFFEDLGQTPHKLGEQPRGFEVGKKGRRKKFIRAAASEREDIKRRFPGEEVTFKQGELTATIAERMAKEGVPGAAEYAEYTRLKIANQMFYRNYAELAGADKKLRTTFRQAYVKSGRMSVERFQAQALPKKLALDVGGERVPEPRSFFGVPEGKQRWNLDLSQAELRIGSHIVGAKAMYEVLDAGTDLHGATCERLFGIKPGHPDWDARRDLSKRANFGLIFNMGAVTFRNQIWHQAGVDIPMAEIKDIVEGWRGLYPEFGRAWKDWFDYSEVHGHVILYNGERSWFGPRDYPNTALNRVVQGSLASWVAEWLVLVEQVTEKHDALVLTVHDSVNLDLDEGIAEEVVAEVIDVSQRYWVQSFGYPGKVDAKLWSY